MTSEHTITVWPSLLIRMESAPNVEQSNQRPLADWTRLLAEGDDGAWRWFHACYYVTLLRYAAYRSGEVSAASEIVQQAYLRIARHAKSFTEEPDFSNWLRCIVRCVAADHSRNSARRSLLVEKFAHWRAARSDPAADWPAFGNQNAALAREALAKLPDADAELLRRKYCEGFTTDELATELATTPKAIEHRLARLRGQLREIILRIQ